MVDISSAIDRSLGVGFGSYVWDWIAFCYLVVGAGFFLFGFIWCRVARSVSRGRQVAPRLGRRAERRAAAARCPLSATVAEGTPDPIGHVNADSSLDRYFYRRVCLFYNCSKFSY